MREEKYMDYDIEMNKKDYQREKRSSCEAVGSICGSDSNDHFAEIVQSDRRTYRGETQAGADTAGLSGYDGEFLHRIWRGWRAEKGVPTLVVLQKIRFGVRNAH